MTNYQFNLLTGNIVIEKHMYFNTYYGRIMIMHRIDQMGLRDDLSAAYIRFTDTDIDLFYAIHRLGLP